MPDEDGYPTKQELRKLARWPVTDPLGWFAYAKELWHWEERAVIGQRTIYFSTGGWSGNEDIIGAMIKNRILWFLYWKQSRRGGHEWFKKPKKGGR